MGPWRSNFRFTNWGQGRGPCIRTCLWDKNISQVTRSTVVSGRLKMRTEWKTKYYVIIKCLSYVYLFTFINTQKNKSGMN